MSSSRNWSCCHTLLENNKIRNTTTHNYEEINQPSFVKHIDLNL